MSRFLDHVVRSARRANTALDPAERRPPLRAAEPDAGADAEDTSDSAADAAQITEATPATQQIAGDPIHAPERSAARPAEASRPPSAAAAQPSPSREHSPKSAEAAPRISLSPLGAPGAPASAASAGASHTVASAPVAPPVHTDDLLSSPRAPTALLASAWIAESAHEPRPPSRTAARATTEAARSMALTAATITDVGEPPLVRGPLPLSAVAAPASSPAAPSTQSAPAAPASASLASAGSSPARTNDSPSSQRAPTALLASAWIAAGAQEPRPPSRTAARATTETARSMALTAATITDVGEPPPARGPLPPSAVAAPASLPAVPTAHSAPTPPAPRIAAPQSPAPPARELHIEHLDVRVIQEPPPRAAVRSPSPARHASPRGAWRPSARRFLKQP